MDILDKSLKAGSRKLLSKLFHLLSDVRLHAPASPSLCPMFSLCCARCRW